MAFTSSVYSKKQNSASIVDYVPNTYRASSNINRIQNRQFRGKPMPNKDEDSLCVSITSKNRRDKVYSGVKTGVKLAVPKLIEYATRYLQKHIDEIIYTRGIPFKFMVSVLQLATPDQLYKLEYHNPYILEESHTLWEQHCQRTFKCEKRMEMETWREMYSRCVTERENRLKRLTKTIKQSQSVAMPVRQTKLAYIDNVTKLSNVIKTGIPNASQNKLTATASRNKSNNENLKTTKSIIDKLKVLQPSSKVPLKSKPKKAPLMAKVLKQYHKTLRGI